MPPDNADDSKGKKRALPHEECNDIALTRSQRGKRVVQKIWRKVSIGRSTTNTPSRPALPESSIPVEKPLMPLPSTSRPKIPATRSQAAARQAKSRDGKCVLSEKVGALDACHIVSWAATKDEDSTKRLANVWEILEYYVEHDTMETLKALLLDEPNKADHDWNLITLNPYLHRLWDNGYFGLKPLGVSQDEYGFHVRIQLIWFFQNDVERQSTQFTRTEYERMFQKTPYKSRFTGIRELNCRTHRELQNGQVVSISFDAEFFEEADRMLFMFKIRWAASKIQFMAGGAGLDLDDPFNEDEDDYEERVHVWDILTPSMHGIEAMGEQAWSDAESQRQFQLNESEQEPESES